MAAHELPVLNQIASGVGMGSVMFWPVWLAAFFLGVVSFARRQRVSGSAMVGLALAPAIISGVFFVLVQQNVDVGAEDSLMARALSAGAWTFLGLTALCVAGILALLVRWGVRGLGSKRGPFHA